MQLRPVRLRLVQLRWGLAVLGRERAESALEVLESPARLEQCFLLGFLKPEQERLTDSSVYLLAKKEQIAGSLPFCRSVLQTLQLVDPGPMLGDPQVL